MLRVRKSGAQSARVPMMLAHLAGGSNAAVRRRHFWNRNRKAASLRATRTQWPIYCRLAAGRVAVDDDDGGDGRFEPLHRPVPVDRTLAVPITGERFDAANQLTRLRSETLPFAECRRKCHSGHSFAWQARRSA